MKYKKTPRPPPRKINKNDQELQYINDDGRKQSNIDDDGFVVESDDDGIGGRKVTAGYLEDEHDGIDSDDAMSNIVEGEDDTGYIVDQFNGNNKITPGGNDIENDDFIVDDNDA